MSAPRTKRQFAGAASDPAQRQITSFFDPDYRLHSATSSSSQAGPPPILPPSVQANLLSVGMRVRKSVPEGYKTGSSYSGFKLWTDGAEGAIPASTAPKDLATQRELLPFCGIHRVGGLAAPSVLPGSHIPAMGGVSGLGSQESVESTLTIDTRRARKRFFDEGDEAEEPVQVWRDRDAWLDGEISPRTVIPVGWGNARVMAVPRKSRRKVDVGASMGGIDQENMSVDDFQDADFLDYRMGMTDLDMGDA